MGIVQKKNIVNGKQEPVKTQRISLLRKANEKGEVLEVFFH